MAIITLKSVLNHILVCFWSFQFRFDDANFVLLDVTKKQQSF